MTESELASELEASPSEVHDLAPSMKKTCSGRSNQPIKSTSPEYSRQPHSVKNWFKQEDRNRFQRFKSSFPSVMQVLQCSYRNSVSHTDSPCICDC